MSNQKKNIFEFFKAQYEEKSNQDQGWNAPPEFVFEDAISQVNAQKSKKKRYLLLFLLAGFIVSGVIMTNLYFSSRINNIEQQVNKLHNTAIPTSSPSTTLSQATAPLSSTETKDLTNNIQTVASTTNTVDQQQASAAPSQTKTPAKRLATKANTNNTDSTPVAKLTKITLQVTQEKQRATKQEHITNTQNNNTQLPAQPQANPTAAHSSAARPMLSTLALLQTGKITSLSLDKENPQLDKLLKATILSTENLTAPALTPSSKFGLAILAKANYSSLKMKGPGDNSQSLTLYDKYYSGYGAQLNVQLQVTKNISLLGSASFDKMKNKSVLSYTMSYDHANESTMGGGMAMYMQDNELSTPMGELEDRMRFMVDPLAYANGTPIDQYSNILQSISVLGLHLGPQVSLLNSNKVQWTSALQFGVNYVDKMLTSVSSEYKIMNHTMSTSEYQYAKVSSMKKLSTSLSLSTYIYYELCDKYSLTVGISTMRSLTSLRSQTPPSTKLLNWSTQVGLARRF